MNSLGGNVFLYLLTFRNGKQYAGVTRSPLARFREHSSPCVQNKSKVAKAVRKYGRNSFDMVLVSGFDTYEEAFEAERMEISKRNLVKQGYNLSGGGGEGILDRDYLVGVKFDFLTVISDSGKRTVSQTIIWNCKCSCGKEVRRSTSALRNIGANRKAKASCGCKGMNKLNPGAKTHGHTTGGNVSTTFKAWLSMRRKGIKFCKRWEKFENFLADMGERKEGLCLCRKDKAKSYAPENCFWGTRKDVSFGASVEKHLTAYGETKSMAEWSRDERIISKGISYTKIRARKNILKWSDAETLEERKRK